MASKDGLGPRFLSPEELRIAILEGMEASRRRGSIFPPNLQEEPFVTPPVHIHPELYFNDPSKIKPGESILEIREPLSPTEAALRDIAQQKQVEQQALPAWLRTNTPQSK